MSKVFKTELIETYLQNTVLSCKKETREKLKQKGYLEHTQSYTVVNGLGRVGFRFCFTISFLHAWMINPPTLKML